MSQLSNLKYSPFQEFVITLIEEYPNLKTITPSNKQSWDYVFYVERWATPEELITAWFKVIDKEVRWYHELPVDLQFFCRNTPYIKQNTFKDAFTRAYQFAELYEKLNKSTN